MVSRETTVINPQGFHMRPASVFAQTLAPFKSNISIIFGEKTVDAKSLMSIMAACIKYGSSLTVTADGVDEEEALAAATSMIDNGLGEI